MIVSETTSSVNSNVPSNNQLSSYATGPGMGDHPKSVQLRTGGGGDFMTYALTPSLFMFLPAFLFYSVLFICRN